MIYRLEDGKIMVKLEDGENVLEKLKIIVKESGLSSGVILNGVGMLRKVKLGYFDGKGYVVDEFEDPMELVSMQGNISSDDKGNIIFHIHVGLADRSKSMYGGHLLNGIVNNVNEILIMKLERVKMRRRLSEKTGLMELFLE